MKKKIWFTKKLRWMSAVLSVVMILLLLPPVSATADDTGILAEGIYRMENLYAINNFSSYGTLNLRSNGIISEYDSSPDVTVSTYSYGGLDNNIYNYWYLKHLGNNEYVILSVADPTQGLMLSSNGTDVILRDLGDTYAINCKWIVSGSAAGGYMFTFKMDTSKCLSVYAGMLNGAAASDSYFYYYLDVQASTTQNMSHEYWRMNRCNDFASIGIEDKAAYYIMNGNSERYLSLASNVSLNGTGICTNTYSSSTVRQWKVTAQDDLSYQLLSMLNTNKACQVSGGSLILYTDTNADSQKFRIERIDTAENQGLYYIRYGNKYLSETSDHNVTLITSPNANSVWSFAAVNPRGASYYSITFPNTNSYYDEYETVMSSLGYTVNHRHCVSSSSAYSALRGSDDVFVFIGHGLETDPEEGVGMASIIFQDSDGNDIGHITANSAIVNGPDDLAIDDLPNNDLALARCVLYLGCKTGQSYTVDGTLYNLVQSTYDKGAHFVLGTLESITVPQAYMFLDYFLENCSEKSVYDSIGSILNNSSLFDVFYLGDFNQYLRVE